MSTVETEPGIKTENVDYKVYVNVDSKTGKIEDVKPVSRESQFKTYEKEDSGYVLAGVETVRVPTFTSIQAFQLAVPDPGAQLDVINRGTGNKIGQKLKEVFTKLNASEDNLLYVFGEKEYLEALDLIQKPPKRKKLTATEKLMKDLEGMNLPEELRQSLLAQIIAAQAATTHTADDSSEEEEEDDE